jgi:phosphatidate cytidylyltransferase
MSDDTGGQQGDGIDEDPPIYRSGRVRIIGAEPASPAAVSPAEEPTPVADLAGLFDTPEEPDSPDMPHWNDAPTGQVPAVLDRSDGEEPSLAPPTWREEDTDWAAHEELFEPSMLSDDLPAVGSLVNDNNEKIDVDRQPWHFDDDDLLSDDATMVLGLEFDPIPPPAPPRIVTPPAAVVNDRRPEPSPVASGDASRLNPPAPPKQRVRQARTSRVRDDARNSKSAGTSGRNMQVAIGSGLLLGIVALLCFKEGPVSSLVLVTIVVLLASAEAFAAFRKAHSHPATLLGLVATLSLMVATYNKGVAAFPLVIVILLVASFIWFMVEVEPSADPVTGLTSTMFVFVWIGGLGSFSALLLNPTLFPARHGVAYLLAAVLTTAAADVGGLLVGSAMGRHPMAPSISPNKSWEGFIGGAVASVLMAVIVVHFVHPWTISKSLILGLVVAVVAPLGDLSQSMVKRHLGLKDMGTLMPGHGGILDRFDGLLFVLPATYFVVKALHLG